MWYEGRIFKKKLIKMIIFDLRIREKLNIYENRVYGFQSIGLGMKEVSVMEEFLDFLIQRSKMENNKIFKIEVRVELKLVVFYIVVFSILCFQFLVVFIEIVEIFCDFKC